MKANFTRMGVCACPQSTCMFMAELRRALISDSGVGVKQYLEQVGELTGKTQHLDQGGLHKAGTPFMLC